jgi:hypothetical protein
LGKYEVEPPELFVSALGTLGRNNEKTSTMFLPYVSSSSAPLSCVPSRSPLPGGMVEAGLEENGWSVTVEFDDDEEVLGEVGTTQEHKPMQRGRISVA